MYLYVMYLFILLYLYTGTKRSSTTVCEDDFQIEPFISRFRTCFRADDRKALWGFDVWQPVANPTTTGQPPKSYRTPQQKISSMICVVSLLLTRLTSWNDATKHNQVLVQRSWSMDVDGGYSPPAMPWLLMGVCLGAFFACRRILRKGLQSEARL